VAIASVAIERRGVAQRHQQRNLGALGVKERSARAQHE
jgi:hypothetical protein